MNGKKIILIVTGGIAVYKSCYLVREIRRKGGDVRVVMTDSATEFVSPLTFATLSGNPVLQNMFPESPPENPIHLQPSDWGDILVIAPATANFIGKLANGIADDLPSSVCISFSGKFIIAPAMNHRMWGNPAVKDNVSILRKRGFEFVGPESGEMAGVNERAGEGRMSEPDQILKQIEESLAGNNDLFGKSVIVTSGPTRESIDPVRFISNRSSGKMGDAIARQAALRGAEVTLIRGKGAEGEPPCEVKTIVVETAAEMSTAVKKHFSSCHLLVMTAAVSDWSIANPAKSKLKKHAGDPDIHWKQTEDILAWAGQKRTTQAVVGFALETSNHLEGAQKKLKEKNVDMIVLNDPTQSHSSFGGDSTKLTLLANDNAIVELPVCSKKEAANRLLDNVSRFLQD